MSFDKLVPENAEEFERYIREHGIHAHKVKSGPKNNWRWHFAFLRSPLCENEDSCYKLEIHLEDEYDE